MKKRAYVQNGVYEGSKAPGSSSSSSRPACAVGTRQGSAAKGSRHTLTMPNGVLDGNDGGLRASLPDGGHRNLGDSLSDGRHHALELPSTAVALELPQLPDDARCHRGASGGVLRRPTAHLLQIPLAQGWTMLGCFSALFSPISAVPKSWQE
ncbi:hypothetical protein Taro_005853 [Colocasia esculenta]|uniref:Uncharacterized protein n=1 Tax=Colocasia esculenta TaxID=4460 RepID=A0A843TTP2_COLES|nr:hypothetical protein [Colocasia esculenta]